MSGVQEPNFILAGDRKYHFLIATNCRRVRNLYPHARIFVFDYGFTAHQVAELEKDGVTVIEWVSRMTDPATFRAALPDDQLRKLTLAFNARRTGFRKRFRKFMLKRFPRSSIARRVANEAVRFEIILAEKIRCMRHASDLIGAQDMVFLDADAILFERFDEVLETGADVTVTLIDGIKTREVNRCFVLNSGVLFFGSRLSERNVFLDAWWNEACVNLEWLREQTALVRLIERIEPAALESGRETSLSLSGTSVRLRVVPCRIYNFFEMENVAPESFPEAKIYHFTGRRQEPEAFSRLLQFLDRRRQE